MGAVGIAKLLAKRAWRCLPRGRGERPVLVEPSFVTAMGRDLGNYLDQLDAGLSGLKNPFCYYRMLVDELRTLPHVRIVPLVELMDTPTEGTRVIGLRHDVDADPVTALRCARYLARQGICGSFYLLHTAPYYGQFYGNAFVRLPQLADWVRGFLVAGCELGLHNDVLGVYRFHGREGLQALVEELAWFRAMGVRIRGTVAHNSGPVYGAENFEVFSGRQLWNRTVATPDGWVMPLGILDEWALGLCYEGTFAAPRKDMDVKEAARFFTDPAPADVRSEAWMRQYLLDNPACEWRIDYQFWLTGKDAWVIGGGRGGWKTFDWNANLDRVLDFVRSMPGDTRSVFVVHPEYVRG